VTGAAVAAVPSIASAAGIGDVPELLGLGAAASSDTKDSNSKKNKKGKSKKDGKKKSKKKGKKKSKK